MGALSELSISTMEAEQKAHDKEQQALTLEKRLIREEQLACDEYIKSRRNAPVITIERAITVVKNVSGVNANKTFSVEDNKIIKKPSDHTGYCNARTVRFTHAHELAAILSGLGSDEFIILETLNPKAALIKIDFTGENKNVTLPLPDEYYLLSLKKLKALLPDKTEEQLKGKLHRVRDIDLPVTCRCNDSFTPSAVMCIDMDLCTGFETFGNSRLMKMLGHKIYQPFFNATRVVTTSNSARVVPVEGSGVIPNPAVNNSHTFIFIDPRHVNKIKEFLLNVHWRLAMARYFNREDDKSLIDPSVGNRAREVFEGAPAIEVHHEHLIKVLPKQVTHFTGEPMSLDIPDLTEAEYKRAQANRKHKDHPLYQGRGDYIDDIIHDDLLIDVKGAGLVKWSNQIIQTLSKGEKLKCQVPSEIRENSVSWNGIIRHDKQGELFLHDNGVSLSYKCGNKVDRAFGHITADGKLDFLGTPEPLPDPLAPPDAKNTASAELNYSSFILESVAIVKKLAEDIIYGFNPVKDSPDITIKDLEINESLLCEIISKTYYSSAKGKYITITGWNSLSLYKPEDLITQIRISYGCSWFNEQTVYNSKKGGDDDLACKSFNSAIAKLLPNIMLNRNQMSKLNMRVDMFADESRSDIDEGDATIFFTHKPFKVSKPINEEAVRQYKEFFPQFDNLIDMIVYSRFAADRKRCHLWINANSDWGKGFLNAIFASLQMNVEFTVAELEKAMSSSPSGKSMSNFKRAFLFVINEFDKVKREIKQLENFVRISPKGELEFEAEIFFKMFWSAEDVASLTGSHGVEKQFATRFNYMAVDGYVADIPMFKTMGKDAFRNAITDYTATRLNSLISKLQIMGDADAKLEAERGIDVFWGKYRIGNSFKVLSDNIGSIAGEMAEVIKDLADAEPIRPINAPIPKPIDGLAVSEYIVRTKDGYGEICYFLKKPAKFYEWYVNTYIELPSQVSLRHKKNDVMKALSTDKDGVKERKIDKNKTAKSVKVDMSLINQSVGD